MKLVRETASALKLAGARLALAVWPNALLIALGHRRGGLRVRCSGDRVEVICTRDGRVICLAKSNFVYLIDMIRYFDYYHAACASIAVRRGGRDYQLVDYSTPRLHDVAGFDDFPILCQSLVEPFVTAQQYLDFAQLQPGEIAFDLGSYSALTSIAFSKAVGGSGRVVALEPDPQNHATCRRNIDRNVQHNRLDNIVLIQAALGSEPGALMLSAEGAMGSALIDIAGTHRGTAVEVRAVTLAGIAHEQGLDHVDFIKMDIEGSELAALTASADFLRRHRPRMIIEPHYVDGVLTSDAVVAFLTSLGYSCALIEQFGVALPLITAMPSSAPLTAAIDRSEAAQGDLRIAA